MARKRETETRTHLSKTVRTLSLLVLVTVVPLLLRVPLLVGGGLQSAGLERDVGSLGVEVSQRHQVDQDPHSVGVQEQFHVLSVVEEFVDELEESVSLCPIFALGTPGGGGGGGEIEEQREKGLWNIYFWTVHCRTIV